MRGARTLGLVAVFLIAASGSAEPRAKSLDCGDPARLEFFFTQPAAYAGQPSRTTWADHTLVTLDSRTGLSGRDLLKIEIAEVDQRVFVNRTLGEMFEPRPPGHLVPALRFRFSRPASARFRAIEAELTAEQKRNLLSARGLAILVGDEVLCTTGVHDPTDETDPEALRTVEFGDKSVDELVRFFRRELGCDRI